MKTPQEIIAEYCRPESGSIPFPDFKTLLRDAVRDLVYRWERGEPLDEIDLAVLRPCIEDQYARRGITVTWVAPGS